MVKKKEQLPQLPEAELDVLSCLLQHGHMTARDIRESLEQNRPMAHASVVTLLNRLEQKELVRKEKARTGKAFIYQATRKPASVYRCLVQSLLNRVFAGNGMAMVQSLFESKPPDEQELDALQSMLDKMRENQNE